VSVEAEGERKKGRVMRVSVDNEQFDRALSDLLIDLDALVALLRGSGETVWAPKFESVKIGLQRNDARAFDSILDTYGGMGSFNDLLLHPVSGHEVNAGTSESVNRQLVSLRSRIWTNSRLLRDSIQG
jgi:hypothetical protein